MNTSQLILMCIFCIPVYCLLVAIHEKITAKSRFDSTFCMVLTLFSAFPITFKICHVLVVWIGENP